MKKLWDWLRSRKRKEKRVTFIVSMSEKHIRMRDELMKECGIKEREVLFNTAMSMLKWASEQVNSGRVIIALDEKTGEKHKLVQPWMVGLGPDFQ